MVLSILLCHQTAFQSVVHSCFKPAGSNHVQASSLADTVRSAPHNIPTVVLSIDDFYLKHDDQLTLARSHPDNPLIQHRGQPSTHDIPLAESVFSRLKSNLPVKLPQYDKSRFNGLGDRADEAEWKEGNVDASNKIQIVIFEGWCVGFMALPDKEVRKAWNCTRESIARDHYVGRIAWNRLEDLLFVNDALKQYEVLTS